ncbi:RNA-binding domain-containing protein [Erysipelothrix urinaevulpis]|uniref:RNA-binding domain-containing protein n=1 Tax=Erysipelothrix urinaevulpis TaxID=2683717 RepID=UPI00135C99C1|nr:RNA-binding domain-containing protein [Erysipelothrix urinaevulpis]
MNIDKMVALINLGEGINIEFKKNEKKLSKDVYESICAFLNTNGGHVFLGVRDDGKILGVNGESIKEIKETFVTTVHNPKKINPPVYLNIEEYELEGETIFYIFVPKSSQVHRCSNRVYIRNEDGDLDITDNTTLLSNLYANKQSNYIENTIYKAISVEDLETAWFNKVRKYVKLQRKDHPWITMTDLELLKSAGLYLKNPSSGEEGITLAGILIFGTENTIQSVLPHYRIDALLRRDNTDRYDDRDDIRTNLLSSYERLMNFVKKHINDSFYLEGDVRISLRDKIYREAVSNVLIHRDFSNPYPAKMIIEKNQVYFENANKPNGFGEIDPSSFAPFPKNPTIAKFFKEIGWVDELGSGIRNIYKYNKMYVGIEPKFIEGDIFNIYIPLKDSEEAREVIELDEIDHRILEIISENPSISIRELEPQLTIKRSAINTRVRKLIDSNIIVKTGAKNNPVYNVKKI